MAYSILDAMRDENLFRAWFKDPVTWSAWRAFLCALFGLPLKPEQLAVFQRATGRVASPTKPTEAWLVCGRRSGKSFILALCAVWIGCFKDHRRNLAPGERGTIIVIARDRPQARVILRYIRALLTKVPMLAKTIERETAEGFDLANSVTIEVGSANYKSIRGYTIIGALCDEIAFWPTGESTTDPDYEILAALRPAMATIPNPMLLCASSPYARRGALWEAFRKHHGRDDSSVLVWKADTRTMNPTVPQRVIDEAMERDPLSAAAEYLAEFRTDIESFISREAIEACISFDVRERAPMPAARYFGFIDPCGGSADSMTLAVGHKEGDVVIVDAIRERKPPFSPEDVVAEFSALLKSYHVARITGDRYAGEWPREQFRKAGISYEPAQKPKSDLYRDVLPLINSRRIDLLDHPNLIAQLCALERRTARGGRDSIDHAPGAHDDVANAVAGLAAAAAGGRYRYDSTMSWVSSVGDGAADLRMYAHVLRHSGYFNARRW